jgi:hypothetical protein
MSDKQSSRFGCANIPISLVLAILGGGYWWLFPQNNIKHVAAWTKPLTEFVSKYQPAVKPNNVGIPSAVAGKTAPPSVAPASSNLPFTSSATPPKPSLAPTLWQKKAIRGIYLSRYQITNNTDEKTIRRRVRYYHDRGINTIIHGVWGNGCTMYKSQVTQQAIGINSCPNLFQEKWLDWTIDEAHKHGMQVHAYFEKGIKIDE